MWNFVQAGSTVVLPAPYLPGDIEQKIADFISHYNHLRYHESIATLTTNDVYFGRGQTMLLVTLPPGSSSVLY